MPRRAVIGVPRSAEAVPRVGFATAMTIAAALAGLLAMTRWLFVGTPGIESLLLVPFFFVSAPLVVRLCGHGVVYWDKRENAFLTVDAMARPLLATLLLGVYAVASVVFVAVFLDGSPPGDGCLPNVG